jgi:hypothetical protein
MRKLFSPGPTDQGLPPSKPARAVPFNDKRKSELLVGAMLAAAAREYPPRIAIQDGVNAGLVEADVRRLWDDALAEARRRDARLAEIAA